ncbi:hypothetical protein E4U55_004409 [Claviceps digitariae]|nr:hypothetical protein E4U55_004409 [Claviceps digitariae]
MEMIIDLYIGHFNAHTSESGLRENGAPFLSILQGPDSSALISDQPRSTTRDKAGKGWNEGRLGRESWLRAAHTRLSASSTWGGGS